jgi:hypothetical protein
MIEQSEAPRARKEKINPDIGSNPTYPKFSEMTIALLTNRRNED